MPTAARTLLATAWTELDRTAGRRGVDELLAAWPARRPPAHAASHVALQMLERWQAVDEQVEPIDEILTQGAHLGGTLHRAALLDALGLLHGRVAHRDRAAMGRHLDAEAVRDRLARRRHARSLALRLACRVLAALPDPLPDPQALLLAEPLATIAGRRDLGWPLRTAALAAAAHCLPPQHARRRLGALAEARDEDPWVRVEAMERLFERLPPPKARAWLTQLCEGPRGAATGDPGAFVRARAMPLAARVGHTGLLEALLGADEPSEHVRAQAAAALAAVAPGSPALARALRDPTTPMAVAASIVTTACAAPSWAEAPPDLVGHALRGPPEVQAMALDAVQERLLPDPPALPWCAEALATWAPSLAAPTVDDDRSVAARLLHSTLRCLADPPRREALLQVWRWSRSVPEGTRRRFRRGALAGLSEPALLEVLEVAAADDLDLSAWPLRTGWCLQRGLRSQRSPWRLLHEVGHPRPDKRQAHSHLVDAVSTAPLVALSRRMSEVTPTAVPGQPVARPDTLWWGHDHPLPRHLLGVTRAPGRSVRFASPGRRTRLTLRGPATLARARLNLAYPRLAAAREASVTTRRTEGRVAYHAELERLGFHLEEQPAAWPMWALVEEALRAALATDSNTLGQLAVFATGALAAWVLVDVWQQAQVRRWRRSIPLVVGGWGSRGKSGTERLKAALFHGHGHTVIAKTTGCEAMVVASIPDRPPTEIFLYRPYDKATIVEQRHVVAMAARLGTDVMLWECMALNPRFVDILQQGWMRDDLSTLTNTYPDHEDIQGPSGRDVADVIARFTPPGTAVLTTEQHMTPVLRDAARERRTRFTAVPPAAWQTLPADLLARIPYDEHPRNVALVVRMADALGIPMDRALATIGDHVVPDLGVLKVYGPTRLEDRDVRFINGMSANERAGFLSNWRRMALSDLPETAGLDDSLVVLVNNRADRPARQEVFARIAACDVQADVLAVIGTNVAAFGEAYRRARHERLRPTWKALAVDELPDALARHLRRHPHPLDRAWQRVAPLGLDPAASERLRAVAAGPLDALQRAVRAGEGTPAERWLREVVWLHRIAHGELEADAAIATALDVLAARTLLVLDPGASGDQVLHQVLRPTPPQADVRILGCSNIKGTGLDFVYRWVTVDDVLRRCAALLDTRDTTTARRHLQALAPGPRSGVADLQATQRTLDQLEAEARHPGLQSDVTHLRNLLQTALASAEHARDGARSARPSDGVHRWVHRSLDGFDSVRRRHAADTLYDDLVHERVGMARAAGLAKALVARQKV